MTETENIKALECCADENNCAECPLKGTRFELDKSCENELMKASAELLKSKNAKIEELQLKIDDLERIIVNCNSEQEKLQEQYHKDVQFYQEKIHFLEKDRSYHEGQIEAYRFALKGGVE